MKVPDARVNYIYTPGKGACAVQYGQSKNAKETLNVSPCFVKQLKRWR